MDVDSVSGEPAFVGSDLCLGDAAVQVGADVLRLRGRRVVDVAADVEVEVVVRQLGNAHHVGEAGDVLIVVIGRDDLLDVLGAEVVLRAAGGEFAVGVDEQNLAAASGETRRGAAQDEDAGRDAGAGGQVGRGADTGVPA